MGTFKFANVILEHNPRSASYPTLYCRTTGSFLLNREEQEWELYGPGTFDFTTYFNCLSVQKIKRYTVAKGFYLHLEVKGDAFSLWQTRADTYSSVAEVIDGSQLEIPASDDWQMIDVELAPDESAVIMGFGLDVQGSLLIRNSYYSLDLGDYEPRQVELVLATTTFKKEDFITANIALVKSEILGSQETIADHFHMYVIDNGRTLDAETLTSEGVTVIPNNNVGGAGGFARGMIAAIEQKPKATNVLLMDDDVAVSPESIKRTFNLLGILNEEYEDAFISGAMMNYEIGEDLWEDLGFMTKDGFCRPVKGNLRMSLLHDIVLNETIRPTKEQQRQMYAAWWYCCIPMATIEKQGLPLPIFVRFDDVEYGLRCKPKFVNMNGICIWHLAFHARYSAAVERYQTTRNAFIAQAITGMAEESDFLTELHHNVQLELKKFNYTNAELALDGFEDYLKGPEFIMQPVAEQRFMDANRNAEKLVPFEQLKDEIAELGFDLSEIDWFDVFKDQPRTAFEKAYDFLSFNGQRVSYIGGQSKVAIIPADGWAYPAGELHGSDTIIAIDAYNRKGVIRRKDEARFKKVWSRYKHDIKEYRRVHNELNARYAAVRDQITSMSFWKHYLGID